MTRLSLPQFLADLAVIHRLERPLPVMYLCYAGWGASFASGELVALAGPAVLLAVVANLLLIVGGLALNTAVDVRTDQHDAHKAYVAGAALRVGRGHTLYLAGAELAAAVASAGGVALLTGRWIVPGLALTAMVLQIMYNIEPVRLKRQGLVGSAAFGLAVVGLPFLVAHYAVAPEVSAPTWLIVVGVTALAIGRTAWWAAPDQAADMATGLGTPPVRHGANRALWLACLIMLAGLTVLAWGLFLGYGPEWVAAGVGAHAIVLIVVAAPLLWRSGLPAAVNRRRGITVVAIGEVILAVLSLIA